MRSTRAGVADPVGFAAELYFELMMLSGDEGARRIIARYPAVGVDVDDPGVLLDLDTEADLVAMRALHEAARARPGAAGNGPAAPRHAAFADPRPAQGTVGRDDGASGAAIAGHHQAGTVEPAKARCSNGADGPKA